MFCTNCGGMVGDEARFCSNCCQACGGPTPGGVAAQGPIPGQHQRVYDRVQRHLPILAGLWVAAGVLRLLTAGGGFYFFDAFSELFECMPFHMHHLVAGLAGLGVLKGLASLAAGWGLYQREGWARTLALILAVLSLPFVPFGTALGIYTFWVLGSRESELSYRLTHV